MWVVRILKYLNTPAIILINMLFQSGTLVTRQPDHQGRHLEYQNQFQTPSSPPRREIKSGTVERCDLEGWSCRLSLDYTCRSHHYYPTFWTKSVPDIIQHVNVYERSNAQLLSARSGCSRGRMLGNLLPGPDDGSTHSSWLILAVIPGKTKGGGEDRNLTRPYNPRVIFENLCDLNY